MNKTHSIQIKKPKKVTGNQQVMNILENITHNQITIQRNPTKREDEKQ